jgi:hypothetical protein
MRTSAFAFFILIIASPMALGGQTSRSDPDDIQVRIGSELVLDLPKRWEASVGLKVRYSHNATTYQGTYLSGEVGYATRNGVSYVASYRLAQTPEKQLNRFGAGLEYSRRVRAARVSGRAIVQVQPGSETDDEQSSSTVLRTRLRVRVPLGGRLTPYGSVEPFFTRSGPYFVDNWRNTAGVQLQLSRNLKLDPYYTYRLDYAKVYNRKFLIYGLDLSYAWKPFK